MKVTRIYKMNIPNGKKREALYFVEIKISTPYS